MNSCFGLAFGALIFQLHVMDSVSGVGVGYPAVVDLSTPCNGFGWYLGVARPHTKGCTFNSM